MGPQRPTLSSVPSEAVHRKGLPSGERSSACQLCAIWSGLITERHSNPKKIRDKPDGTLPAQDGILSAAGPHQSSEGRAP